MRDWHARSCSATTHLGRQQLCVSASASVDAHGSLSRRAVLGTVSAVLLARIQPALATTPAEQLLEPIKRDFVDNQYYVTGNLTRSLFDTSCVFKDPTVEVVGVEPYAKALQTLFDPATSRADLISLRPTGPDTLELRWRLEGSLKVGGLRIKPYTGTTLYTIAGGKVVRHEETWDISTLDAFVSTFIPSFGAPPAPPVAAP
ncbi:hypothetical protein HXX76_007104 [Chlamydomonas incerta]|uniref:SnoaL-like domain-containing protein n=1 Tax=Chlamydomonas incerta TaxID=51695 RepID=A0A835SZ72_CHLIN|nr:hypothetical protein HXX76_007104 [Chlamydomonas incerta]|eukprot:KAG2435909.1 hypothetical protein HXX76_007104 [Chlamydomonas incerta]